MSNIILLEDSVKKAYADGEGTESGKQIIFDADGKTLLSSKEFEKDDDKTRAQKEQFRYALPVGADYRYYKIKGANEKWFVGYVKGRPIPKKADPLSYEKAFTMMYGVELVMNNESKDNWRRIQNGTVGQVNITLSAKPENIKLIRPDKEDEMKPITELSEKHNL